MVGSKEALLDWTDSKETALRFVKQIQRGQFGQIQRGQKYRVGN